MHIVDVELGLVFVIDDYLGPTCEVYWESYGSRVEDQALLFRGRERGERRLGKSCRAQFRFIQNEMECFLISRKYYRCGLSQRRLVWIERRMVSGGNSGKKKVKKTKIGDDGPTEGTKWRPKNCLTSSLFTRIHLPARCIPVQVPFM